MTSNEFVQNLRSGESVFCIREAGTLVNTLAVYPWHEAYIFHWEECEEDRRNRQAYTRNEITRFEEANDILAYVESCGYPASGFAIISGKIDWAKHLLKYPQKR